MKTSILSRIALLLLALTLILATAACGNTANSGNASTSGNGSNAQTTTPPVVEDNPIESLPDITYNYEDFTILLRNGAEHISDIAVEKLTSESSSVDKAVYERNLDIQERFQVNFVFVTSAVSDFKATVNKAVQTGDHLYDVIAGDGRTVFDGVIAGYYIDWNELEHIDLDGEWWSQSARKEWATPGGRIFAMNGDLSYMSIGNNSAMYFNKTVLNDAGITSPYTHAYANTWTMETFAQMVKQVDANLNHDNTNAIETDSFGYATQQWRGPIYATFSAGIGSLVKNSDGKYEIGFKNETIHKVVETYLDLVFDSDAAYYGTNLTKIRNAFASGNVIFTDDNVKCAVSFKGSGIDFGIVPVPKANEDVPYSSLVGSGTNTFAVIKTLKNEYLDRASLILEAMACYGHVDVIPYYYDTILSYQAMQDEDSLEMLKIIRSAGFFDLGHYTTFGDIADITKLIIDNPGTYGQNIYTAIAVLESRTMAELEIWYYLDQLK